MVTTWSRRCVCGPESSSESTPLFFARRDRWRSTLAPDRAGEVRRLGKCGGGYDTSVQSSCRTRRGRLRNRCVLAYPPGGGVTEVGRRVTITQRIRRSYIVSSELPGTRGRAEICPGSCRQAVNVWGFGSVPPCTDASQTATRRRSFISQPSGSPKHPAANHCRDVAIARQRDAPRRRRSSW